MMPLLSGASFLRTGRAAAYSTNVVQAAGAGCTEPVTSAGFHHLGSRGMLTCVNKTRTFPCLRSQTCPTKPHPPSVLLNPGGVTSGSSPCWPRRQIFLCPPSPSLELYAWSILPGKEKLHVKYGRLFEVSPNNIFCVGELFIGVSKGVFWGEVGVLRLGQ